MEWEARQSRIDEFLDLYKQLEDVLEIKYRNARRHYSSVVFEFIKDDESAPVRDKLEICREIRNLLTHSANLEGEPVVEPSAPVVEAMGEVLDFARRPPLAMEFATKGDQVMRAHMHQRVLRLMEVMEKNGYSHIPVMEQGEFRGVFSVGTVFQYILRSGGKGIQPDTTVADLAGHIGFSAHMENYEFVPKDATYISVRRIFERVRGKNQRVSVIFITEHGKVGESLLGMLTPLGRNGALLSPEKVKEAAAAAAAWDCRKKRKKANVKVFDQTFFKKFAGCGAAPHGLKGRSATKKSADRGRRPRFCGWLPSYGTFSTR